MRILLDECIPRRFKNSLAHHDCHTVAEQGWGGKRNGELLALAEKNTFQVFVTVDRGIEYQQNLKARSIAILLLRSQTSRLSDLLPLVPSILKILASLKSGQFIEIAQEGET